MATKEKKETKKETRKYFYAVGRRKNAVATVRVFEKGKGEIIVNGKPFDEYFTVYNAQQAVMQPLVTLGRETDYDVEARVSGGGVTGQAESVRHGISRALVVGDEALRTQMKKHGLLTRDARRKERKKPGLKGARRAPQWSKR